MCVCTHVCASMCTVMEEARTCLWKSLADVRCPLFSLMASSPHSFEIGSLTELGWTWSALIWLKRLATKPQGSAGLCLPSARIADTPCCLWLFTYVLGTWAQVVMFPQKALSLSLLPSSDLNFSWRKLHYLLFCCYAKTPCPKPFRKQSVYLWLTDPQG